VDAELPVTVDGLLPVELGELPVPVGAVVGVRVVERVMLAVG